MADQLTPNSISQFYSLASLEDFRPVVQISAVKKCAGQAGTDKHKFLISDGSYFTTAVAVGTEINKLAEDGIVKRNTIVKIDRLSKTMATPDKPFFLILDMSVVAQHDEKIGNPAKVDDALLKRLANNTARSTPAAAPASTAVSTFGGMAGSGPVGAIGNIYPISSLNPYQNKWTIQARVTKKGDVRTWSNARGEGKLFSMDLMDDSGEIRCTGFSAAVDKFYDTIEQGKVYYISRCTLKTANKQYTSIKNDYEMTITNDTSIVRCEDDAAEKVPQVKMNCTNIADLESCENNSFVDVIGVASQISDVQSITVRSSGKQLTKREVKLQDKSGAAVSLTLWGADAEKYDSNCVNSVFAVKAAKVSDFGGRSLSVSFSSTLQVNPDSPESHELRGWYDTVGKDQAVRQMSSSQGGGGAAMQTAFKTFQEIKSANIQDKPEYFSNNATVVFVKKDNCMYQACPSDDCNKKVIQESQTEYRCEKCNKLYPDFQYRLMLSVKLSDFTGNEWVTCFQDTAEKLLGISAAELGNLKDSNEAEFDKAMNKINFTSHNFKMRARMDSYMDETRMKCTAVSVEPIEYLAQSKRLFDEIRLLEG